LKWWESRSEGQEELLEAVSVETAELSLTEGKETERNLTLFGFDIFLVDSQTSSQMPTC
jgi:hypothetical protein